LVQPEAQWEALEAGGDVAADAPAAPSAVDAAKKAERRRRAVQRLLVASGGQAQAQVEASPVKPVQGAVDIAVEVRRTQYRDLFDAIRGYIG
jgi:hypothetical protein